jgi:inner membrane protein
MDKPTIFDRLNNWARRSVTLKLIAIGILVLILLIPTSMLTSLVNERQSMRDDATAEVSSKWGSEQTIGGPVISVPYTIRIKNTDGSVSEETQYAHFLPDDLKISGTVNPEKRYRGIYVVVLYNARLKVSGNFKGLPLDALNIGAGDYQFENAVVTMGIPDMKGINENISIKINDTAYNFNPGIPVHDIFASGSSFKFPISPDKELHFEFDLNLNGSSELSFLPFGKETNVTLQSSWNSPSFSGSFLPDQREIQDNGFTATWKVLQLNRNYSQQGTGSFISQNDISDASYNYSGDEYASFGVKLLLPVDEYQKTIRSIKYCIMFIIITFITFFFIEVLNKQRIHPIQYLLVGFAICLFYVLLLAISEHLKFNSAYLISCVCILTMVTLYAKTIFRNNFLTGIFAALLALLYGFFYSLLQLEDYALLLGSIGLFIILATIMYLTRKIDWYDDSEIEKRIE